MADQNRIFCCRPIVMAQYGLLMPREFPSRRRGPETDLEIRSFANPHPL
jgi:hypothetical protein